MGVGGGLGDSGAVTGWEPPRRFATGGVRWEPAQDGPPAELATEWTVEARDGGTCVVRMVISGFGSGAAWDNEIDGMSSGMRAALDSLRGYLGARAAMAPARVLAALARTGMRRCRSTSGSSGVRRTRCRCRWTRSGTPARQHAPADSPPASDGAPRRVTAARGE